MAIGGQLHVSSRRPGPPEGADFALKIDFKRGDGDPKRVFQTADKMIRAMQRIDRALCGSIDANIEPMMVLEDVEAGSLKIYLRNLLEAVDDQALKDLDWKKAVGKYLVRAKYVYIDWVNRGEEGADIVELVQDLSETASQTDVLHIPDYEPPSIGELAESVREIDDAKSHLIEGDKVSYIVENPEKGESESVDFDLSVRWSVEELEELLIKETVSFEKMPMNLIVKKPDYLGESKWDMRHGKRPLSVRIADDGWLKSFQSRKVDVRPGDALKCWVTVENSYGHDNELIKEEVTVTKVERVLENEIRQKRTLFDSED